MRNYRKYLAPILCFGGVFPVLVAVGYWFKFFQYDLLNEGAQLDVGRLERGGFWFRVGLCWLCCGTFCFGNFVFSRNREPLDKARLVIYLLLHCGWVLPVWQAVIFAESYVFSDLVPLVHGKGRVNSFPVLEYALWCVYTGAAWLFVVAIFWFLRLCRDMAPKAIGPQVKWGS